MLHRAIENLLWKEQPRIYAVIFALPKNRAQNPNSSLGYLSFVIWVKEVGKNDSAQTRIPFFETAFKYSSCDTVRWSKIPWKDPSELLSCWPVAAQLWLWWRRETGKTALLQRACIFGRLAEFRILIRISRVPWGLTVFWATRKGTFWLTPYPADQAGAGSGRVWSRSEMRILGTSYGVTHNPSS